MVTRGRLAFLVALALGLTGLVAVLAYGALRPDDRTRERQGIDGALRPAGIPPARFRLPDENGRMRSAAALRGKVAAVMFVYAHCTDTCPLTAQQVRGALDRLHRPDVTALAISVDPAGDTPDATKRFLGDARLLGRVPYLRGTRAQLRPVWRAFGVKPQSKESEHAVSVVLLDRRGRQRIGFDASDLTADGLTHDLGVLADLPRQRS
jgi:protein SCO1/2